MLPILCRMKQVFNTSVGRIEASVDRSSRTISIYRFNHNDDVVGAAIESWDHVDLRELLNRQFGLPLTEASRVASEVREHNLALGSLGERLEYLRRERPEGGSLEKAGIPLRFVAVLLDTILVFFPLALVVGLLTGGGYAEREAGSAQAGINVGGNAIWWLLALGVGYYVACEALTGMTLGKKMVGIRVVREDGEHLTVAAAVVRNVVRLVDALVFYLVGFLFAIVSPRGQRLGDRVAGTVVVRKSQSRYGY
jgi:uncharacterized RDD family membrane protein YckC